MPLEAWVSEAKRSEEIQKRFCREMSEAHRADVEQWSDSGRQGRDGDGRCRIFYVDHLSRHVEVKGSFPAQTPLLYQVLITRRVERIKICLQGPLFSALNAMDDKGQEGGSAESRFDEDSTWMASSLPRAAPRASRHSHIGIVSALQAQTRGFFLRYLHQ